MNARKALLLGGAVLLGACAKPNAYLPPEVDAATVDPLAALDMIRSNVGQIRCTAGTTSGGFGAVDYSLPTATVATGAKIGLTCPPNATLWTVPYRAFPAVSISSDNRQSIEPLYWICARQDLRQPCQKYIYVPSPGPGVRAIVQGWASLGRRAAPVEPAADVAFQEALRNAPSDTEPMRRALIQAEAAVRAQNVIEAARVYRAALQALPQWPAGHFNLALIYGELELYPEAMVEMKRYLYLAPQAADARAAKDKIYEWEAAEKL
ncbi:MAG TPA: hypothetical protein VM240_12900 [Verrucomicrobiae bacterium]|nr:hypothetical protein [Verrucomicrobiae bacterium]